MLKIMYLFLRISIFEESIFKEEWVTLRPWAFLHLMTPAVRDATRGRVMIPETSKIIFSRP